MPTAACLSRDELQEFSLGRVSDEAGSRIAAHLDTCPACEEAAAVLDDAHDSLVAHLRLPEPESSAVEEPAYQRAAERIKAFAPPDDRMAGAGPQGSPGAGEGEAPAEPAPREHHAPEPEQLRDYRILEKLGEGGMGTVYKAVHTRLDRVVALKILHGRRMKESHAVRRFEREVRSIGRFDHPAIVRATDAGETDGTHFLVTEYVDGLDLSRLAQRLGPLPVTEACELIRQAARGLQHVHEQGLVHRDVKPSNLMLNAEGQVKILDMGLALLQEPPEPVDELTTVGQLMGTLDYMAPEQGDDSHEVDIRADVYSLGATLYRLLCGEAPFGGARFNSPVKKLRGLAVEPVPPLRERRPDVQEKLAAVLDRMLAKNPAERFATPAEVAEALQEFAEGADPVGLLEKAREAGGRGWRTQSEAPVDADAGASLPAVGPAPATRPQPGPQRKRSWPRRMLLALLAGAVLFAGGFVIRVVTDTGELVIRAAENVRVQVKQGEEVVKDLELEQGETKTTLRSGKYEIELLAPSDGLQVKDGTFTLTRDGEHVATIERATMTEHPARHVPADRGKRPEAGANLSWHPLTVKLVDRKGRPVQGRISIVGDVFAGGDIELSEETTPGGLVNAGQLPAGEYSLNVYLDDLPERTTQTVVVGPERPQKYSIVCPNAVPKVPIDFQIALPGDLAELDLYYSAYLRFEKRNFAGRGWRLPGRRNMTFLIGPDSEILGRVDKDAFSSQVIQPELVEEDLKTVPAYSGMLVLRGYLPVSETDGKQKIPVLRRLSYPHSLERSYHVSDDGNISIRVTDETDAEKRFWTSIRRRNRDLRARHDRQQLEGVWEVVKILDGVQGRQRTENVPPVIFESFQAGTQVSNLPIGENFGFELAPTTTPKQIDLFWEDRRFRGIYDIEDGRVRLCISKNESGKRRPQKFAAVIDKQGYATTLIVLERKPPEIAGRWQLKLPAGFEHEVTFEQVDDNLYRFKPRSLNFSGLYEFRKGRLVIVEPDEERLTGFEWAVRDDNTLVLVEQPPTGKTGSNYRGAVLTRKENSEAGDDADKTSGRGSSAAEQSPKPAVANEPAEIQNPR